MVGVMLGVCSLMGLPWFVAATVLSISHVNSLKLESECSAPGEQPKFLGIREQRFTGLMIFTLMGCSVFMTSVLKVRRCLFDIWAFCVTPSFDIPWLIIERSTRDRLNESNYWHNTFLLPQFIPMPVLYGVFLYMGASSLKGIQVTTIQNFTEFKATPCNFWSHSGERWLIVEMSFPDCHVSCLRFNGSQFGRLAFVIWRLGHGSGVPRLSPSKLLDRLQRPTTLQRIHGYSNGCTGGKKF